IAVAINDHDVEVTATSALADVTITCVHKGDLFISLTLEITKDEGDVGKNTLTLSGDKLTGGNGYPDETVGFINLAEDEYDYQATPFSSTTNLDRMRDFLDARWQYNQQKFGHCVTTHHGNFGEHVAVGLARNDKYITNMGVSNGLSPAWTYAAALGAIFATHLGTPPELSRPLQTLVMKGCRLPGKVYDLTERNSLLYDGIATFNKNPNGQMTIDRAITMYRLTDTDNPDASWLDVNTLAQMVYFVRFMKGRLAGKFPRSALVNVNPNNIAGQVSPPQIKREIEQGYLKLINLGVVENFGGFNKGLSVKRDDTDSNRVNIEMDVDVVNQLIVMAAVVTSHLQIEEGA
ncbi:MAG: phage tail sheath subtilisin-like domain-containing protein, partial [Rhizobiales bacterium]|nr:phage tail sheath subtilisin-like domain-containing protein [Hyphomicrobiales bacterium]